MSDDPGRNEASVGVASGPLSAPVLGRVVGILAARADCPIDRLDDALLIADAVAATAGAFSADGRVNVRVTAHAGDRVELRVGPLRSAGADELIAAAALPGIGNVLERVADELERTDGAAADASGEHEYLRIRISFAAQHSAVR